MQRATKLKLVSTSFYEILSKTDNKVAKMLTRLAKYEYHEDSLRNITIRKDKVMTFCPPKKQTIVSEADDGNESWSRENRQEGKYGKVLKKVLTEQVPRFEYIDADLENLVNFLKAEVSDGEFSIVKGDDIAYWYNGSRYADNTDTLSNSCMRHNIPECFDVYVKNPQLVQMVILVKGGKLLGRALLWDGVWMDRIYGTNATVEKFINYAKDNGLNRKYRQSYDDDVDWVNPGGDRFTERLTFSLNTEHDHWPYMDTFKYMSEGTTSNDCNSSHEYVCNETGGGRQGGEDYRECCVRGDRFHVDDMNYLECRDDWAHQDECTYDDVNDVSILSEDAVQLPNGQWTSSHNDDVVYVASYGGYVLCDDIVTCGYDGTDYYNGEVDLIYLEELGMDVHEGHVAAAYEAEGYEMNDDGNWVLPSDEDDAAAA